MELLEDERVTILIGRYELLDDEEPGLGRSGGGVGAGSGASVPSPLPHPQGAGAQQQAHTGG